VSSEVNIRRLGIDDLAIIDRMNREIFGEKRIINSFDRGDLLMLLAEIEGQPVGFKLGYRQNRMVYYSAKGGVLPAWRNQGIAVALMDQMIAYARASGYRRFAYDTFPNKHPGMAVLGLKRGFRITEADFNRTYEDFRIRFETSL
jgi:GNAT superfamily N-acetyltransferase